jgi:arylsulfatase A-like enzyme
MRNNPVATLLAAACALLTASVCAFAEEKPRPNIVLVISDDQRWDCVGAAGNPAIQTPAIDRLAREGTHFLQATIHVPQCSPSRATLLTGLAPHQHGWFSNQAQQSKRTDAGGFKKLPMIPSLLQEAGYRTVLVGKWHIAADPWDCGFSDVRVWLPAGGGPYVDAGLAHGNSRAHPVVKGFINQIFGDDAVAFLNSSSAKEKPFLLWVALTAPHMPIKPNPADIEKLYAGKTKAELMPPGFPRDRDAGDWQHYYEACTMADRQLGNVLDALDKQELAKKTLVIFLGDNGFMMGARDMRSFHMRQAYMGKVFPYEDSVRVPMLIRGNGFSAGASDAPVSSLDLPPTILKAAGITIPSSWPGRDLHDPSVVADAVCEFADNESDKFGDIAYRLVRTRTHKLIVWESKDRPDELYDLKNDPRESKNLAADLAAKEINQDLHARLQAWMKKTSDPALKWKGM